MCFDAARAVKKVVNTTVVASLSQQGDNSWNNRLEQTVEGELDLRDIISMPSEESPKVYSKAMFLPARILRTPDSNTYQKARRKYRNEEIRKKSSISHSGPPNKGSKSYKYDFDKQWLSKIQQGVWMIRWVLKVSVFEICRANWVTALMTRLTRRRKNLIWFYVPKMNSIV